MCPVRLTVVRMIVVDGRKLRKKKKGFEGFEMDLKDR